ncbi:hypothetical protein L596_019594 [Steinernema carpocapsae]|uniref:USP8 dimerisation domain-containing protein n=1 Tax=Steinernema carpocapsae TaxID=34508 RepID=A0A4U5MQZ8_STECR|nr:hypothetical protein L596_019594 [Steinernema carpocapsae]
MNSDVLIVLNPKVRFEQLVAKSTVNVQLHPSMPLMRLIDALCLMKRLYEEYFEARNLEYAYMYGMRILSVSKAVVSRQDYCSSMTHIIENKILSKEFYAQMEQIRDAINHTYAKEAELLSKNMQERREQLLSATVSPESEHA